MTAMKYVSMQEVADIKERFYHLCSAGFIDIEFAIRLIGADKLKIRPCDVRIIKSGPKRASVTYSGN